MLMMMDNKKLAQGIAGKLLRKSKENPEIKEEVKEGDSYDQAKMDSVNDLMGAIHEKDAGRFLSAFKALHHSMSDEVDAEDQPTLPEFPENNYGDKVADANPVKK